ncbi:hypothetical protein [Dubosiella newyorkensis]|uniref:hypothetical protein n=1 Tax=Dubosiella newyorkensis TaxID=1862672 RepID=UPI003F672B5F
MSNLELWRSPNSILTCRSPKMKDILLEKKNWPTATDPDPGAPRRREKEHFQIVMLGHSSAAVSRKPIRHLFKRSPEEEADYPKAVLEGFEHFFWVTDGI